MLLAVVQKGHVQEVAPGFIETLEDVVRTHKQPGGGGGYQDILKRESQKQSCVGVRDPVDPSGYPLLVAIDSEGIGPGSLLRPF